MSDSAPQPVLELLADVEAREILLALEEPMTTAEVAETCDIPLSTAYRKLDALQDAGLVSDEVRLRDHGSHPTAYQRAFDDVHVRLGADGAAVDLRGLAESVARH